jgi:hypothetical protein
LNRRTGTTPRGGRAALVGTTASTARPSSAANTRVMASAASIVASRTGRPVTVGRDGVEPRLDRGRLVRAPPPW